MFPSTEQELGEPSLFPEAGSAADFAADVLDALWLTMNSFYGTTAGVSELLLQTCNETHKLTRVAETVVCMQLGPLLRCMRISSSPIPFFESFGALFGYIGFRYNCSVVTRALKPMGTDRVDATI